MFEEPTKSQVPSNLPLEEKEEERKKIGETSTEARSDNQPEDIFAKTEEEIKTSPVSREKVEKIEEEIFKPKSFRSSLKWIIIVIVVVLLIGAGYLAYSKLGKELIKKYFTTEMSENKEPAVATPKQSPSVLDTDKDGLTDEEEGILGTNPNSPDSDKDGLSDRAEVSVYKTNPLNSDTDGDGYLDGQEIKSGHDPNDPAPGAKLRDLQKEIEKLKE